MTIPAPTTDSELDDFLSRPTAADREAITRLDGDFLILGAGGKMGPSLARLARRAADEVGRSLRVIAVSRFRDPGPRETLASAGVETVACDLLDAGALERLPDARNVVLMVGQKFGTVGDPDSTWAVNAFLPGLVARRYARSRIVAFSTGNVYPLMPAAGAGANERTSLDPVGEYAHSAAARERVLAFLSSRDATPLAILRLNYAVELRYGVLRDLADRVWRNEPIDLTMGYVNLIWQRDACSAALRSFPYAAAPPFVLNVTGRESLRVRDLAKALASRLGREAKLRGTEAPTALLSDASACARLFGPPTVSLDTLLDWTADWVRRGGRSLGRPTHYERRDGRF